MVPQETNKYELGNDNFRFIQEVVYYQRDKGSKKTGKKPHITVCILEYHNKLNNSLLYSIGVADWHNQADSGTLSKKLGRHIATSRAILNAKNGFFLLSEVLAKEELIRQFKSLPIQDDPNANEEANKRNILLRHFLHELQKVRSAQLSRIFSEQILRKNQKKEESKTE